MSTSPDIRLTLADVEFHDWARLVSRQGFYPGLLLTEVDTDGEGCRFEWKCEISGGPDYPYYVAEWDPCPQHAVRGAIQKFHDRNSSVPWPKRMKHE